MSKDETSAIVEFGEELGDRALSGEISGLVCITKDASGRADLSFVGIDKFSVLGLLYFSVSMMLESFKRPEE